MGYEFPRQCPVCTYIMYRDTQAHDCTSHLMMRFDEVCRERGKIKAELEEWRCGKRRVFWEAECIHHWVPFINKKKMFAFGCEHGCVMGRKRVTVKPVTKQVKKEV